MKHNKDVFLYAIITVLSTAVGFMIACVIKPDVKSIAKRKIEPIPVEIEVVEINTQPVVDVDNQRRIAIQEAKRIEAYNLNEYSDYEMALIAKVVRAEAGNQDDVGKRLVVDCILNRVDSGSFPNTVEEVVTQENQFSMYEWYTIDDLNAVTDEIVDRTDKEIVFFRTKHYSNFGKPAYQYGDHYFSTM